LLDAMMAHPVLINRPIVVTPNGVRLCRPQNRSSICFRPSAACSSRKTANASPTHEARESRDATARPAPCVPYAVGLYITSAYWFTASTSFANPTVTIARSLSDTFAGIAPSGVLPFIAAQLVGAVLAVLLARWLWRRP
jgi:glycerol uptake facilitator-like aquaporin